MGITNQLFPQERDETSRCLFNATPEDTVNFTPASPATGNSNTAVLSAIEAFAAFMRMLAPPTPAPATPPRSPSLPPGRSSRLPSLCPPSRSCSPPPPPPPPHRPARMDGPPLQRLA